jgi:hypothetical protein
MLPSLRPGDVIAVRPTKPGDINPGKLAVCALKDADFAVRRAARWDPRAARMTNGVIVNMFTVHRAVSRTQDALITRGDALPRNDAPVEFSRVFGEVAAIQRGRSSFVPKEQVAPAGKLLCFFLRRSAFLGKLALRLYSLRQAMNRSPLSAEWSS